MRRGPIKRHTHNPNCINITGNFGLKYHTTDLLMRRLKQSKRKPKRLFERVLFFMKNRKYRLRIRPLNQPKVLIKNNTAFDEFIGIA
jgi:hypothetical protein